MNNLIMQVTPLQVTHHSNQLLQLSCVFKKKVISTGHTLQRHQLNANNESTVGSNRFPQGPVFSLSKEMELNNTKIEMNFMAKKDRKISCIGSAQVDLATLPSEPLTVLECSLSNSIHPQSKLTLEIRRREERKIGEYKAKKYGQEMNVLRTEGQIRQQWLQKRRKDPSIPTAYEISRKNYKQTEISRNEQNSQTKKKSTSKGSYHNRYQLEQSSNSSRIKVSKKTEPLHRAPVNQPVNSLEDSPVPRQRTPEPIGMTQPHFKSQRQELTTGKYTLGLGTKQKLSVSSRQQGTGKSFVKPYEQQVSNGPFEYGQGSDNCFNRSSLEWNQAKKDRYLDITEKLQAIQDRLISNDAKCKTEADYSKKPQVQAGFFEEASSELEEPHPRPISHRSQEELFAKMQEQNERPLKTEMYNSVQNTKNVSSLSNTSKQIIEQNQKVRNVQFGKDDRGQVKISQSGKRQYPIMIMESNFNREDESRLRKQVYELEVQNRDLIKQNQLLKAKHSDAEATVQKLMRELSEMMKVNRQKEDEVGSLKKKIEEVEARAGQQQKLLNKITGQYELKVQEAMMLQDELAKLLSKQKEQIQQRQKGNRGDKNINGSKISEERREEISALNKKIIDIETALRLKQNEVKHMRLEIENERREKKALEQEIQVMSKGSKSDMARQKSIAHIQQVQSNSLMQVTQRENQNLKMEVKALQEKVQALNQIFASMIQQKQGQSASKPDSKQSGKIKSEGSLQADQKSFEEARKWEKVEEKKKLEKMQEKVRILELKCGALQEELRTKKNLMAEMINIIWNYGSSELMQNIERFMDK